MNGLANLSDAITREANLSGDKSNIADRIGAWAERMTYDQQAVDNGLVALKDNLIKRIDTAGRGYDILQIVGELRSLYKLFEATRYKYKGVELLQRLEDRMYRIIPHESAAYGITLGIIGKLKDEYYS